MALEIFFCYNQKDTNVTIICHADIGMRVL